MDSNLIVTAQKKKRKKLDITVDNLTKTPAQQTTVAKKAKRMKKGRDNNNWKYCDAVTGENNTLTSNIILGLRQIDVLRGIGGNNKQIWSQTRFHAK